MRDNGANEGRDARFCVSTDLATMIMAYDRLVVENANLARANAALQLHVDRVKQDRDALVTCVMLLVQALDRQGPEVKDEIERARKLVGAHQERKDD